MLKTIRLSFASAFGTDNNEVIYGDSVESGDSISAENGNNISAESNNSISAESGDNISAKSGDSIGGLDALRKKLTKSKSQKKVGNQAIITL